jgi:hypothetical protein
MNRQLGGLDISSLFVLLLGELEFGILTKFFRYNHRLAVLRETEEKYFQKNEKINSKKGLISNSFPFDEFKHNYKALIDERFKG